MPPVERCVVVPAPSDAVDVATREVLTAHERLRGLTPAELANVQAQLSERKAGAQAALELAIALTTGPHPPADTARALGLVDDVVRDPAPEAAPWQPVARVLQGQLLEQRRLEEIIERQAQHARDTQRRLDQLHEKLEALKAIELNLVTRSPAAPAPPAPAPVPVRPPGS